AIADMALHAGKVDRQDLVGAAAARTAGVRLLRQVLEHVEPAAESPMETRLRMVVVLAGLPRPEAQVAVRDRLLRVIGRLALYYRDERLGLEYDGGTHRDTLAEDNRRQNRLLDADVRLLRFTARDILHTPDHVIGLVRAALAACAVPTSSGLCIQRRNSTPSRARACIQARGSGLSRRY